MRVRIQRGFTRPRTLGQASGMRVEKMGRFFDGLRPFLGHLEDQVIYLLARVWQRFAIRLLVFEKTFKCLVLDI